jgi:steroid 5-alpha reductase family enzyme
VIEVLLVAAGVAATVMVITWLVSLRARDASIVDLVWGATFVIVASAVAIVGDGAPARRVLLAVLVGVWGVRLSAYLARRNLGHGEDYRYRAMRERHGARFGLVSLVVVFGLQGVLVWVVSLPVQLSATAASPRGLGPLAFVGVLVWAVGFGFEAVGDAQLGRFKRDPASEGRVMDRGLWRYTRHPNYFGDFCVWWGIFLVAAETGPARVGVVGPLVMSFLLLRVSGVAMLERTIGSRRPGYADYVARTSAFFPRPPRRPAPLEA